MIKPYIPILIVIILLIGGAVFYSQYQTQQKVQQTFASIQSIRVKDNAFVVQGQSLGKVELWAIPTGTGIQADSYIHMGDAHKTSTSGGTEEWSMDIPHDPLLITGVFAKGFNAQGNEVGSIDLPITGATALYDTLWGSTTASNTASQKSTLVALTPGEKTTFKTLTLTFKSIVSDSRCPVDVQCIQRGNLTASLTLQEGNDTSTIQLKDTDKALSFKGYTIVIKDITPEKRSTDPVNKKYTVSFLISQQ